MLKNCQLKKIDKNFSITHEKSFSNLKYKDLKKLKAKFLNKRIF